MHACMPLRIQCLSHIFPQRWETKRKKKQKIGHTPFCTFFARIQNHKIGPNCWFGGNMFAISDLLLCKICWSVDFWIWTWNFHFLNIVVWTNHVEIYFCLHPWIFEALSSFLSITSSGDVRKPQSKFQSLRGGDQSLVVKHNIMFLLYLTCLFWV